MPSLTSCSPTNCMAPHGILRREALQEGADHQLGQRAHLWWVGGWVEGSTHHTASEKGQGGRVLAQPRSNKVVSLQ